MNKAERARYLKGIRSRVKTMETNFAQHIEEGLSIKVAANAIIPEMRFLITELDKAYAALRVPIQDEEDELLEEEERPVRVRRRTGVEVEGPVAAGMARVQATRDNSPRSPGAQIAGELATAE